MRMQLKFVRKIVVVLSAGLALASQNLTAAPALSIDQASSITGAADTLKAARVPVVNNAGAVSYWDVTLKFTADGISGKPALTPANIAVSPSPSLLSAAFRAGKYKDIFGNIYTVTGPGATTNGRSNWNVLLTKPGAANWVGYPFSGNWTTGPIAGHPIQNKITAQKITVPAYSYGTVANLNTGSFNLYYCSSYGRVVGYVQVGDKLVLHGFCDANNVESAQFTLNQCSTTNPCP